MMAGFNFALLDLADGESGEAAVSAVVGKAKAQAEADARKAESTAGAEKEKPPPHKNIYFTKLQHDNGIRNILHELKRLREVLTKLRGEETKLKEEGGDGGRLMDLSEEQRKLRLMHLSEEQRKLRQQQRKLREQEAKLRPLRKEFYLEHGFSLGVDEEETQVHGQGEVQGVDNVNGSCNSDGNGNVRDYHNDEPDVRADGGGAHVYREYVYNNNGGNNNGGRHGYPKRKVQRYVVKANQPSSDASTDQADHTPEDKVTSDAGSEAPVEIDQEEAATPANADAAPASGLENSSAVARATSSNNGQSGPRTGTFLPKEKLNGSMKRKKKNANGGNEVDKAKKQGSSEIDLLKKVDKEPLASNPMEEEKKTLAEYERIREEKKKSSVKSSRSAEARKVSAEEFEGLRILEKKKLDDESVVMKAEKVQHKAKETNKKEGKDSDDAKPKKVVIPMKDLSFRPPRRAFLLEDGTSNGGGLPPRGRFQSRSCDNSTDSRVPAGRGGANGRAFQNDADNYDNVASRGGYQQKGGYQRRTSNSERGYSANGRYPPPAPKPMVVEDMDLFPPLPVSAPSRAVAPATAPAQS